MKEKNLIWLCAILLVGAIATVMLVYICKDDIDHVVKTGSELTVKIDPSNAGVKYDKNTGRVTTCSGLVEYDTTTTELYIYPICDIRLSLPSFKVYTTDLVGLKISPKVTYKIDDVAGLVFNYKLLELRTKNLEEYVQLALYYSAEGAYRTVIHEYSFNSLMDDNGQFDENVKREVNGKVKSMLKNRLKKDYIDIISIDYDCPIPEDYQQAVSELEKAKEGVEKAKEGVKKAEEQYRKAKKEQEKIKATEVTKAEQEQQVCRLAAGKRRFKLEVKAEASPLKEASEQRK